MTPDNIALLNTANLSSISFRADGRVISSDADLHFQVCAINDTIGDQREKEIILSATGDVRIISINCP